MRLLDLFCGAGAASLGYEWSGFTPIGVDLYDQPNYPYEVHKMDAMKLLANKELVEWINPDIIHASPPCQSYSANLRHLAYEKPRYIPELRQLLNATQRPWVIENVNGAPLYPKKSIVLCGTMFGKKIFRHRIFESNVKLVAHIPCDHSIVDGRGALQPTFYKHNRDWMIEMLDSPTYQVAANQMTHKEAQQAIPPYYTEYIGLQLLEYLEQAREARKAIEAE